MMRSRLLTSEKLEIPQALILDHEVLRAELRRAAAEAGRIGKAAERVERLCQAHFDEEEDSILPAFGLLHDMALDRSRPDRRAMAQLIARFSAQHARLHGQHKVIHNAVETLLQEARKEGRDELTELVYSLRSHEKIEEEVLFPAVLQIAGSVQNGFGIQPPVGRQG